MAVGVEDVDKAIARTVHGIMLLPILLLVGDDEIAVDVLDGERRITCRNLRIGEVAVGLYRA